MNRSSTSMSSGVASIIILTQSQKIGTVVIKTRTENTNVQIGSAFYHSGSGLNFRIKAAEMTPILCTMSPRMWTMAALMFMFCSLPSDLLESWLLCEVKRFSLSVLPWFSNPKTPAAALPWASQSSSWQDSMSALLSWVYSFLMHLWAWLGWYTASKLYARDCPRADFLDFPLSETSSSSLEPQLALRAQKLVILQRNPIQAVISMISASICSVGGLINLLIAS